MPARTITVRLKSGSADLSCDPAPILPPAVIQCEQLWKDRGGRTSWRKDQWAFVREAIGPLLYARIEPEAVHYENGLLNPKGIIQARAIQLTSVSFEKGSLPTISAYARFQLAFDRELTSTSELYDWMEATDWLDWALYLGLRLEDGSEYDVTSDHHGIDFELVSPTVRLPQVVQVQPAETGRS